MERAICTALALGLLAVGASDSRADQARRAGAAPAVEAAPTDAIPPAAAEPTQRQVVGYVTEGGLQLPYLQYPPYQLARQRWTAGFCTTWAGLALVGTGIGALAVGSQGSASLTEQGQQGALVAGGVLVALGAAGVAIGATLWHLGRRELGLLERGLPRHEPRPALTPAAVVAPAPGGAQASVGLVGQF